MFVKLACCLFTNGRIDKLGKSKKSTRLFHANGLNTLYTDISLPSQISSTYNYIFLDGVTGIQSANTLAYAMSVNVAEGSKSPDV